MSFQQNSLRFGLLQLSNWRFCVMGEASMKKTPPADGQTGLPQS